MATGEYLENRVELGTARSDKTHILKTSLLHRSIAPQLAVDAQDGLTVVPGTLFLGNVNSVVAPLVN